MTQISAPDAESLYRKLLDQARALIPDAERERWSVAGILVARSGEPFSLRLGPDVNDDGNAFSDRPALVSGSIADLYAGTSGARTQYLLPKTDVFLTNGGYGGVQLALRHGLPIVVTGGQEDKPEVAARVAWAGVGAAKLRSNQSATAGWKRDAVVTVRVRCGQGRLYDSAAAVRSQFGFEPRTARPSRARFR